MTKKTARRAKTTHQHIITILLAGVFLLALVAVLGVVILYNQTHPGYSALAGAVDYAKVHFEGLSVGEEIPAESKQTPIVDAEYDYTWHNISIAVDDNGIITKLGFYTTEPAANDLASNGANIHNTLIDYREYPLLTVSDFVNFFGTTKITNFGHYKYFTYQDETYAMDVTLYDGEVYNIELSLKAASKSVY